MLITDWKLWLKLKRETIKDQIPRGKQEKTILIDYKYKYETRMIKWWNGNKTSTHWKGRGRFKMDKSWKDVATALDQKVILTNLSTDAQTHTTWERARMF